MGRKRETEPQTEAETEDQDPTAEADLAPAGDEGVGDDLIEVAVHDYEELRRSVDELKERVVRQQADFDNIRKRLRREADEAAKRAIARFVRPLLTEMDNFAIAIEHADPANFQEFATGVSMIRENILQILGAAGVEIIPVEGIFDPAFHEVLTEEERDAPKGTILRVHRHGYRLGDQVIRAAQVVVARPPAQDVGDQDTEDAESDRE